MAVAILVFLVLAAAVGPLLWTHDPDTTNLLAKFRGASLANPLGTDNFGRDILARLLHGARLSLLGAALVVAGATGAGIVIGGISGFAGGRVDSLFARLIDGMLALPSLVIALSIVGALGKSFTNVLLALVLSGWPWYARLYRGFVLKERRETYVLAANAIGCSPLRIAWRHIGPNIAGPAIVLSTTNLGNAILGLASLSFLGLGIQPPTAEWGAMVSDARLHFQDRPWLIIAPGLAISITVIAVNTAGDAIRDRLSRRF